MRETTVGALSVTVTYTRMRSGHPPFPRTRTPRGVSDLGRRLRRRDARLTPGPSSGQSATTATAGLRGDVSVALGCPGSLTAACRRAVDSSPDRGVRDRGLDGHRCGSSVSAWRVCCGRGGFRSGRSLSARVSRQQVCDQLSGGGSCFFLPLWFLAWTETPQGDGRTGGRGWFQAPAVGRGPGRCGDLSRGHVGPGGMRCRGAACADGTGCRRRRGSQGG